MLNVPSFFFRLTPLVVGALLSMGCASTSQLTIRSTSRTNDGNTLYMMIRAVDRVDAAEDYQAVAARLFANPSDSTVITSQPIFPGQPVELKLDDADKRNIVIYFFFTDHGANWRVPLRKPLPSEVFIDLGNQQIERIQVKRR